MQPTNNTHLKTNTMQTIQFTKLYPVNQTNNQEAFDYSKTLAQELTLEGITLKEHLLYTEANQTAHLLFLEANMLSGTLESKLHTVLDWNPIEYQRAYFKYIPNNNTWVYCFTFTA